MSPRYFLKIIRAKSDGAQSHFYYDDEQWNEACAELDEILGTITNAAEIWMVNGSDPTDGVLVWESDK